MMRRVTYHFLFIALRCPGCTGAALVSEMPLLPCRCCLASLNPTQQQQHPLFNFTHPTIFVSCPASSLDIAHITPGRAGYFRRLWRGALASTAAPTPKVLASRQACKHMCSVWLCSCARLLILRLSSSSPRGSAIVLHCHFVSYQQAILPINHQDAGYPHPSGGRLPGHALHCAWISLIPHQRAGSQQPASKS